MVFTDKTIVADAIAQDSTLIDRLAAFNPTFAKLRNPVLRRTMARLVNLGEAAKVAGVPLATLLAVANGEAEAPSLPEAEPERPGERPAWLNSVDAETAEHLDVRAMLAQGVEPLGTVMRLAGPMAVGKALILEAPFDPAPLRRVLAGKGFDSYPERLESDHWRITFLRRSRESLTPAADAEAEEKHSARSWRLDGVVHIDVRGLVPPQPMLAILKLLDDPATGSTIIVHHEREPVFLYPELDERGWSHRVVDGEADEVRLELQKEAP